MMKLTDPQKRLIEACIHDSVPAAENAVKEGANINTVFRNLINYQYCALSTAMTHKSVKVIKYLIDNDVNFNWINPEQEPLTGKLPISCLTYDFD